MLDEEPGFINHLVLAELYGCSNVHTILRARQLLMRSDSCYTNELSIEHPDDARAALQEYEDGADFADSLIAATNARAGCEYTATLDRRAARRKGFCLVK